jgi:hypothetical protein
MIRNRTVGKRQKIKVLAKRRQDLKWMIWLGLRKDRDNHRAEKGLLLGDRGEQ